MLSEPERAALRRLGIFVGGFTLDAACAVVADPGLLKGDVVDAVAELTEKSLAVVETAETEPRLRLLETTRAYALERLAESGERATVARRHAEFYRDLLEKAQTESEARSAAEWPVDYAQEIDNLRAALDWAFSPGGEAAIGAALAAAAPPLWMRLSLFEECRGRAKQALGALGTAETWDPRKEMKLHAALGGSAGGSTSNAAETGAAFTKTLEIAESLNNTEYKLRALRGLYSYHASTGRYRTALQFAQKFYDLTTTGSDLNDRLLGERTVSVAQHYIGDQGNARRHLEQVLAHNLTSDQVRGTVSSQDIIRFGMDLRVSARVFLARCCGCRDCRIRRCAPPKSASQRPRRPAMNCRCVTPSP